MSARKAAAKVANLQDTDLNKIVTESYSKSTKANTKRAAKVFQGKYSDVQIHFRFLGVVFVKVFVHSDQHAHAKVFFF